MIDMEELIRVINAALELQLNDYKPKVELRYVIVDKKIGGKIVLNSKKHTVLHEHVLCEVLPDSPGCRESVQSFLYGALINFILLNNLYSLIINESSGKAIFSKNQ